MNMFMKLCELIKKLVKHNKVEEVKESTVTTVVEEPVVEEPKKTAEKEVKKKRTYKKRAKKSAE